MPTETHPPSTPAGAHQQKLVSHAGDDRIRELPVRRGEPFVDEENDPFTRVANDDDPLTPRAPPHVSSQISTLTQKFKDEVQAYKSNQGY